MNGLAYSDIVNFNSNTGNTNNIRQLRFKYKENQQVELHELGFFLRVR